MDLLINRKYMDFTISGAGIKDIKVSDIPRDRYEFYYNKGFKNIFLVKEEEIEIPKKSKKKNDKVDKGTD